MLWHKLSPDSQQIVEIITMVTNVLMFIGFLGFGAAVGAWATDRDPPRTNIHGIALQNEVPPGGVLSVRFDAIFQRECTSFIHRTLVTEGQTRFLRPTESLPTVSFAGEEDSDYPRRVEFVTAIQIPEDAVPGSAILIYTVNYECNPLHKFWPITIQWPPIAFEIVERS